MPNYNKAILIGHLARDLEQKNTTSGTTVATGCLGVNCYAGAGKPDETMWMDFVIYGKRADAAIKYLSKGSAVLLDGKLRQENWVGKDGVKKSKIGLVVDDWQFCGGKSDSSPRQANTKTFDDSEPPF